MNASQVIQDILQRAAAELPGSWFDPVIAQPSDAAREELAWLLLFHELEHLLFQAPLPTSIRVGREHVSLSIDETQWRDFEAEIGLDVGETRRKIGDFLASIMRPQSPPLATTHELPQLASGLQHLLLGFSKYSRSGRSASPRQGQLKFEGSSSTKDDASALVDELMTWAGSSETRPDDRYRIVFHVLWRPLSRRRWNEAVLPADVAPPKLSLPLDFLSRARAGELTTSGREVGSSTASLETNSSGIGLSDSVSDSRGSSYAEEVLAILLEPILVVKGDPIAAVEAAELIAQGFAKDMLRTWR